MVNSIPEIKHDREKKQIEYKHAILKVYDLPVFYFPKFFHPDPTDRQSGFLWPQNNSDTLGTSITQPYFKVISDNKDYTITQHGLIIKLLLFKMNIDKK